MVSGVDTLCLSAAIPQVRVAWAQEMTEVESTCIGSSQIALRAQDPLTQTLYDRCQAISRGGQYQREALGPRLFSAVIAELSLPADVVGRTETFYPIRWIEVFKLWLPEFADAVAGRAQNAWFVPIYRSFSEYTRPGDSLRPPRGSFLH